MGKQNREILTGGKKYAQKQQKKHRVDEVVFDKESREEYLTGFHKRKIQRQKKAQEFNKERERLAKIEERKKIRDERKEVVAKQLERYNEQLKDLSGIVDDSDEGDNIDDESSSGKLTETEEWEGFKDDDGVVEKISNGNGNKDTIDLNVKGILKRKEVYPSNPDILHAANGEDGVVTVTIESMDPDNSDSDDDFGSSNDLEAIAKKNNVELAKSQEVLKKSIQRAKEYAKIVQNEERPKKKKKFRYLSKSERRQNLKKQHDKRAKK
ncbi:hypothetical protein PACTADRAFT_48603 [Pachysolen tannophilus NRRL Y-2460]|uniref:Ribosomal RNA-processing protein 17 n=1 Tax=Pachysolen tannophilus NRRL Y-2460 TaxID=669874 RepID=A0A1E4TYG6_PACTA|nr:hypothetical protein PACTADRAFT_48603 [Pachysolen tannophilus NRRL Y-2460]